MGAPRSVIIDIENKGLSHAVAHKYVAKNGTFNAQPVAPEAVKVVEITEVVKIVEAIKIAEATEAVSVVIEEAKVEETKQEPVTVPELSVENVVKKNAFKKKKNLTDLT